MVTKFTETAISVTDLIGTIAGVAAKTASTAEEVATFLAGVKLIAGFVPGLSTIVNVLDVAAPIIQKIVQAVPIVRAGIQAADPITAAIEAHGADVLPYVKQLFALATNADPARPETNMTSADVTGEQAHKFMTGIFERSFFSPQDPRFDRATQSMG